MVIENIVDPDTGLKALKKQPYEDKLFDIDCTSKMRSTDTISAVVSILATNLGKVTGSTNITLSAKTHDGAFKLQFRAQSGTDLENYRIVGRFTTTGGDSLEVDVILYVRD